MSFGKLNPRKLILIGLLAILVLYSLFQARFLILGPRVWIESPRDGEIVKSSSVVVRGVARNAAWLNLNGRQIFTDSRDLWSEKLIVSEGTSIMTVKATDRFGREREDSIRIIFK